MEPIPRQKSLSKACEQARHRRRRERTRSWHLKAVILYGKEVSVVSSSQSWHRFNAVWGHCTWLLIRNATQDDRDCHEAASCIADLVRSVGYCLSPTWICKWWWNLPSRMRSIYDRYLQKRWKLQFCVMFLDVLPQLPLARHTVITAYIFQKEAKQQMGKVLIKQNYTHTRSSYWSLSRACRQARRSKKDAVQWLLEWQNSDL